MAPMRGIIITALALATAACATPGAGGESRLAGQDLDAAVGLYGPWSDSMVLNGRPTYVWRRQVTAEAKAYYCELHVQTGFRRTISRTTLQGFPDACRLFGARS